MNICASCGKQYTQTLTSFLGVECCPHCHKGIFPSKGTILKITPESRAFYVQAERLFKQGYLLNDKERFGFKDKADALERAVERDKQAGLILHDPYALCALALFYENDYVRDTNDKTVSWKKALSLYEAVGLNEQENSSFKFYTHDNEGLATELEMETREKYELQLKSCIGILRLCKNPPTRFQTNETKLIEGAARRKINEIAKYDATLISKEQRLMLKDMKDMDLNVQGAKSVGSVDLDSITDSILDLVSDKSKVFMLVANITKEAFLGLCDYNRKIIINGEEVHFENAIKKEGLLKYAGAIEKNDLHKNTISFLRDKRGFVAINDYNNENGKKLIARDDIYFTVVVIDMAKMIQASGKKPTNGRLDEILNKIEYNNAEILDKLSKRSAYSEYSFTTDDLRLTGEENPIKAIEKIIEIIPKIH